MISEPHSVCLMDLKPTAPACRMLSVKNADICKIRLDYPIPETTQRWSGTAHPFVAGPLATRSGTVFMRLLRHRPVVLIVFVWSDVRDEQREHVRILSVIYGSRGQSRFNSNAACPLFCFAFNGGGTLFCIAECNRCYMRLDRLNARPKNDFGHPFTARRGLFQLITNFNSQLTKWFR